MNVARPIYILMALLMAASLAHAQNGGAAGKTAGSAANPPLPIHIEADALRYDEQRQQSVFTGNVVMTRGGVTIQAARVEVRKDAQGNQYADISAEPGQRALMRQLRDGENEIVEVASAVIEYNGLTDMFKLIGQAELRRFRGSQMVDLVSGDLIVYDSVRDVYTVDQKPVIGMGQSPGQSQPAAGGRVRAILTPHGAEPAPAPLPLQDAERPPVQGGRP